MIKQYESNLLSFAYPGNWNLEDSGDQIPKEVSLESPEGAVWMVTAFSSKAQASDLWEEAKKSFESSYEDFECSAIEPSFNPKPEIAFEADFFCLDFLVHSRIYVFDHGPLKIMVIYQAESRQYESIADVFDAMTISLISGENGSTITSTESQSADE